MNLMVNRAEHQGRYVNGMRAVQLPGVRGVQGPAPWGQAGPSGSSVEAAAHAAAEGKGLLVSEPMQPVRAVGTTTECRRLHASR